LPYTTLFRSDLRDDRMAAASRVAFCSAARRAACRQGWSAAGAHFRFVVGSLSFLTPSLPAWIAGTHGFAGAGISRQSSARPRYSMVIFPYRPSHTATWL